MAELLTLDMQMLRMAHTVLQQIFADDEPIPEWWEGDMAKLETCCACTEVEAFGVQKYPDLPSKAAKLFYSTIKTHPFPNGNKRFALVLTLGLLAWNDYRLTAGEGVGYDVATKVADSNPHSPAGNPDLMIADLARFFGENIEPYDWNAALAAEATLDERED